MKRLEFAPEAEADLLDIAAYFAPDDPERALSFVDELEARCAGLVDHPESDRQRPQLAADLRSKPHGRYVIFYTPGQTRCGPSVFFTGRGMWRANCRAGADRARPKRQAFFCRCQIAFPVR